MALFARKVKYAATPISFSSLIEIAEKPDGPPKNFILYFYDGEKEFFGKLEFDNLKTAEENFPFGPGGFFNRLKTDWYPTSDCLFDVAAGGSFQKHPEGTWVEIRPEETLKLQKRA